MRRSLASAFVASGLLFRAKLKHLVQGNTKDLGDEKGDFERGRIFALLNGYNSLPCHANTFGKVRLGHFIRMETKGADVICDAGLLAHRLVAPAIEEDLEAQLDHFGEDEGGQENMGNHKLRVVIKRHAHGSQRADSQDVA